MEFFESAVAENFFFLCSKTALPPPHRVDRVTGLQLRPPWVKRRHGTRMSNGGCRGRGQVGRAGASRSGNVGRLVLVFLRLLQGCCFGATPSLSVYSAEMAPQPGVAGCRLCGRSLRCLISVFNMGHRGECRRKYEENPLKKKET